MAKSAYPQSQLRELAKSMGLTPGEVAGRLIENGVSKKGVNMLITIRRNAGKAENFEATLFDLVRQMKALTMTDLTFLGDLVDRSMGDTKNPNMGAMNMLIMFNYELERRRGTIMDWGITRDPEDGQIKPWIKAEKDPRLKGKKPEAEEEKGESTDG